jgi:hypothetical protein
LIKKIDPTIFVCTRQASLAKTHVEWKWKVGKWYAKQGETKSEQEEPYPYLAKYTSSQIGQEIKKGTID